MAKKKDINEELPLSENISIEPLEQVMGDRYAIYAKYVIQDRAIPDVRDGLKPVQRRIIFSMYKNGNTFNKPTKKCAHTVGAVMGTYHPHGDTSIYEALARMSQDWKVRYPLIFFQGNNGSIDGDSPAAYRYTESRLSELSNELTRDIDKETVDMQLNFDDTEFEPVVLPSRFPNLLVNGTEGIAVALATEIPPHNLKEVVDAIIYRINHKNTTLEDLLQFVQGPDFPGGGIIYKSEGLQNIYKTGKGRIEVSAKCEIVQNKDNQQIIISEIPYKVVKKDLVYEIDKIRASKAIDGIIEVRDESNFEGIRIVVDIKKEAKANLILNYLMQKTPLLTSYSANMVAIVSGRPKTLDLLQFVDAYINHQVDVVTRKTRFDLTKCKDRLHIVDGLIIASLNINEVVDIIKKSKDKADSKINLMNRYNFSNVQAEAIVTMPLYKLSHTDEEILEKEKIDLETNIQNYEEILSDPNKLNRVIIQDLKAIANKYGDNRRTAIEEKEEIKPIDKRELIAKEEVAIAVTYDGYIKRSSVKSYRGSNEGNPGLKDGDRLIAKGIINTTDYIVCFSNLGNYACIPVHSINENRWKDEGVHLNSFVTLLAGEKIVKAIGFSSFRNDLFLAIITKAGQIKRMPISSIEESRRSKPAKYMKLLSGDVVKNVSLLSGNSDILVVTTLGNASLYNENELSITGPKAGGVKAINGLNNASVAAMFTLNSDDHSKIALFTDKGHIRVFDTNKLNKTARLGKVTAVCPSFKGDPHKVIGGFIIPKVDSLDVNLYLSDRSLFIYNFNDFRITDVMYAKRNIDLPAKLNVSHVYDTSLLLINKDISATPAPLKEEEIKEIEIENSSDNSEDNTFSSNQFEKEEPSEGKFEQISIFDDLDDD